VRVSTARIPGKEAFDERQATQPGQDNATRTEHHEVDPTNRILNRRIDEDASGDPVSTAFVYDAAGNLVRDGVFCYVYNAFNRQVRIDKWNTDTLTCSGTVATYRYDALGRRVEKIDFAHRHPTVNFIPKEYYYYDGDRVIEVFRTVIAGTQLPGEYVIDDCSEDAANQPPPPPPPPPPPDPTESKRIAAKVALSEPPTPAADSRGPWKNALALWVSADAITVETEWDDRLAEHRRRARQTDEPIAKRK
jgi:hypothetical protein